VFLKDAGEIFGLDMCQRRLGKRCEARLGVKLGFLKQFPRFVLLVKSTAIVKNGK
jgi:hypothetical protein